MSQVEGKCDVHSRQVEVNGSHVHYLETGEGDPIVFIHGMPTSSYLWRNILPALSPHANCIAVDLIGMGKSAKPDINYTVFDHVHYFEGFISELGLKNITLVMHGWGSVIGFEYAKRHAANISSVAFFESHIRPITDWDMLSLPVQQFASLLTRPDAAYRAIVQQNYLIKKLLPSGVVTKLPELVLEEYERPYLDPQSRKVLWQYVQDLPLGKERTEVVDLIEGYSQWLQQTDIPKLMLYAVPGFITTIDTVSWAKDHFSNLTLDALEDVMHFVQESEPDLFSEKLLHWYLKTQQGVEK